MILDVFFCFGFSFFICEMFSFLFCYVGFFCFGGLCGEGLVVG